MIGPHAYESMVSHAQTEGQASLIADGSRIVCRRGRYGRCTWTVKPPDKKRVFCSVDTARELLSGLTYEPTEFTPRPKTMQVYNRLVWEAKQTGEPARIKVLGICLTCYFYRRTRDTGSCTLKEGIYWKMKRAGGRYRSCSANAAKVAIEKGWDDGE